MSLKTQILKRADNAIGKFFKGSTSSSKIYGNIWEFMRSHYFWTTHVYNYNGMLWD